MNNRERFLATMNYQSADHPPIFLSGPWEATLERWHREGLKEGRSLHDYLELDPLRFHIPAVNSVLEPGFEEGGYLPGCDHGVPPDVSLSNYAHFIKELKKIYGM